MKIKLKELLKRITPLPWRMDEYGRVKYGDPKLRDAVCLTGFALSMGNSGRPEMNNAYVYHAATVLPELVEAAPDLNQ